MNNKNSELKIKIYKIVKKIPKGKTLSYKKVAELAGFPRAWRVVGNVLNENKDSKIPCHRVIKSNGSIGGYNKGDKTKIALLRKEGLKIKKKKLIKILLLSQFFQIF